MGGKIQAHGRKKKALVVANLHLRTQYGWVNFAKGSFSESPQAQRKLVAMRIMLFMHVYAGIFCAVFNHCIFTLVSCLMRK